MNDEQPSEKAISEALRALCDGELPQEIALMRLVLATESDAELDRHIEDAALREPSMEERIRTIGVLARQYAHAWPMVRAAASAVQHRASTCAETNEILGKLAADFDKAAGLSPEASVALYSFGDANRLNAATAELVGWIRDAGLLHAEYRILDIGCGIGRLECALSGKCREIVGVDISGNMVDIARRRCSGLADVDIRLVTGFGLQEFDDASFDLVMAVDTMPYLVSAGTRLAERHFADAARILRPAGNLLVLNYSYRGNPEADRSDVRRHAETYRLEIVAEGSQPFRRWDGAVFHLRKN